VDGDLSAFVVARGTTAPIGGSRTKSFAKTRAAFAATAAEGVGSDGVGPTVSAKRVSVFQTLP
jgi:hypothetical protein